MANKNYSLNDNFELKGIWWLPENQENHISGMLSFQNDKKITLDLLGSFSDISTLGAGNFFRPEIIHGITDNGKICTLFNNIQTNSQINAPGIHKSIIDSRYLLIGKHYKSANEIKFSSINANFTNLENWIAQSPFETTHNKQEHTLTYSYPDEFEIDIPAINASIKSIYGFNTSGTQFKKTVWEHTAFLNVSPKEWHDFDWYLERLLELNNFLTLCVGEPVYLKKVQGVGEEIEIRKDFNQKEKIEIFFTQKKPNLVENSFLFDMVLPLPRIKKEFPAILSNWFTKASQLRSVLDLFFGTYYNPGMYLQFHFLALTQALESFHRITAGGKYVSNADWKPSKEIIANSIPNTLTSDHRQSLKSRVKYGNEFSLRKRMKDMLDTLSPETKTFIIPSKNYFQGVIVDTRNYFTHYDNDLKDVALNGEKLFHANQRLKILIIFLLLKEIGVDEKVVIQALKDNRKYNYIFTQIRNEQGSKAEQII